MEDNSGIPIVKTLLQELLRFKTFSDINSYLRLLGYVPSPSESIYRSWIFGYENISGKVFPNKDNGIFLGLERQIEYPNIYTSFAFERREESNLAHLEPVFLYNNQVISHVFDGLEKIRNKTFDFKIMDDGEYLRREAELVLDHAEELPLEEEIPLLELFDLISIKLAEMNLERFNKNKPVIEFGESYNRGKRIIQKIPPEKLTPALETRLYL